MHKESIVFSRFTVEDIVEKASISAYMLENFRRAFFYLNFIKIF